MRGTKRQPHTQAQTTRDTRRSTGRIFIRTHMDSSTGKTRLATTEGSSASESQAAKHARTRRASEEGGGCLVNVLTIALGQASGGKWYASTLELQLASFDVCLACRSVRTLRVTVNKAMPLSLWDGDHSSGNSCIAQQKRRVPALRAAGVAWILPADMLVPVLAESTLLKDVEWMQLTGVACREFCSHATSPVFWNLWRLPVTRLVYSPRSSFERMLTFFDHKYHKTDTILLLRKISWPSLLRQLSIGCTQFERVDWAALPSSLQRLSLGGQFDESIETVVWPRSLKHLDLAGWFNKWIAVALWPASLLQLTLGPRFDQPIADVVWPVSLLDLAFGDMFDQPITDVAWPASLLRLTFGDMFDHAIANAAWPAALLELTFGGGFDKPITDVEWPASLLKLSFGYCFSQEITEIVWPALLTHLDFRGSFGNPIEEVVWPKALQSLSLGSHFVQSIEGISWPRTLRKLSFCNSFRQRAEAVDWPPSLETLDFRDDRFYEKDEGDFPPGTDFFDKPKVVLMENL